MLSMSKLKVSFLSTQIIEDPPIEEEESLSDFEEPEIDRWEAINLIQKELFDSICSESRTNLKKVLYSHNPSLILQVLVTFTYTNHDGLFKHDNDILMDAAELLGPIVSNLNAIQTACMLGEEDMAIDIIDYVAKQSERMSTKKVLYEFMSKVWGSGNTILHLASFMGMPNLVKRLIELGANTNKRNERKYKAVDCADDDKTRVLFLNIKEVIRYPIRRSLSVDGGSITRREIHKYEPIFTKITENSPSLTRSKAILHKKSSESLDLSKFKENKSKNLNIINERNNSNSKEIFDLSIEVALARARSLGSSLPNSSDSNSDEEIDNANKTVKTIKSCLKNTEMKKKRVIFDPKTLALDCARSGDYFQLKLTLENPNNQGFIFESGISNVFDIQTSYSRLSLLHLAASYNHIAICQYLIEHGANINPQDREGWTPLHCAAAEGHESIVKYLLTIPTISLNVLNFEDESPCDVCSQENIRTLLKEKLVKRMNLSIMVVPSFSLEDSLSNVSRNKLNSVSSKSGGDSGLLRPTRSSSHHRINSQSKPFSPPHSFSKPLTDLPISPTVNETTNEKVQFNSKGSNYRYASLASF